MCNNTNSWLPELVKFEDYEGKWDSYLEVLYKYFSDDFINNRPVFQKQKLALKKHPILKGKEITFWHIISEGECEKERIPNLKRSERIRWPSSIIQNESRLKVWESYRNNNVRICIALSDWSYLVVLDKRENYILFWTAYPIEQKHRRKKLEKEYNAYISK